ncbi:MAG TPA: DUF262 domain-containing protein [Nitrospira sp.]|nr:DUF262 domain-containing protein [Nitrospira sp.]HNG55618.1 DUF262 domain-containing protein [Nitrospira sp.]
MRTVTYNLLQFLTEAKRGAFVIPRFQRPFVWNHAQVKLLIDSISRNYPIGSLLLLQETIPNEPFLSSRPIDAVIDDLNGEGDDDLSQPAFPPAVYYVLDGQQRLTSLVRVFLQASKESVYYFDLDKLLETDPSDRNASAWVVRRNVGRKVPTKYIRSDAISDDERCVVLAQEYFESNYEPLQGDRPAQRRAVAKVNRVFETMRNYQIPLVIVDRGDSTEAICRIFETINSTGTRLTTFDLAVARFFPSPDLHNLWQQSKSKHSVLERFSAEGERVLQIVAISSGYEQRSYVEPTRGTLLNLTGVDIASRWDDCAAALAQALEWVEIHGAIPGLLSNDALLVPLAYFLAKITDQWKALNPSYNAILERWYFSHSLQQGARQASNYKIGQTVSALHKWLADGMLPEVPTVRLNATEMLRLAKTDARYQAIISLLRWKSANDLWTEEPLKTDDVEDHHIFPAALAKRDRLSRRLLDSVANRLLVSRATNRTLSDRLPRDYLGKLRREAEKAGTWRAKLDQLRSACIPVDETTEDFLALLDPTNFESFLQRRSQLILDRIGLVLGDSLQVQESASPQIDEDDDQ